MSTTKSVWLKAAAERSLARRHPWVFSGAVTRVEGDPQPGDTVLVKGADGNGLGLA
ncbi:MAG: 23S rRNA (cytosine(1962)-C(5))-methyltransferase RlmI, partial [Actinobacteria bacterium]|nr:23S rRNA (cytosine(1962)-C(5))-methyltransferase RlmI [Actinomycetota bacterium]